MTKRYPIPRGARTTARDIFHSFCPRRPIHSLPSVHGAFGTIDALANRPSRQGAQTIIPLGTISQTMQAILHRPFHAIPDLIRAHASQRPRHAVLVHDGLAAHSSRELSPRPAVPVRHCAQPRTARTGIMNGSNV